MPNGYSLHIGLNYVDPKHYQGWDGKLNACVADAEDMCDIAKSLKYKKSELLLNKEATRKNVRDKIIAYASVLKSGDLFLLTYSGHGGQLPDKDGDEKDGMDETWCLYDGQLVDDEMYKIWLKFKEGVRIFVLSDSCHSGTITRMYDPNLTREANEKKISRFMPSEVALRTYRKNKAFYDKLIPEIKEKAKRNDIKATVRLLSGCMDNQTSSDGDFNGLFTCKLLKVWNEGKFKGNYSKFHQSILKLMPPDQSPQHNVVGKPDLKWNEQKPFVV